MDIPKLQIIPRKYTGETTVISMRLPKDMLKDIDEIAAKSGRTRNELLQIGIEFALCYMEIQEA